MTRMSKPETEIVETLESDLHIQFEMEVFNKGPDMTYRIRPSGEDLFYFDFTFSSVRLSVDFGSDIGSLFVHNMGMQSNSKRVLFVRHILLLKELGYRISVKINSLSIDESNPSRWPHDWNELYIHITKTLDELQDDRIAIVSRLSRIVFSMVISMADLVPICQKWEHMEGCEKQRWVRTYERNPVNRALCISVKGLSCIVCGFNFEHVYGSLGSNFIHVHHLVPISKMKGPHELNPLCDLVPVCPNCHYMLHRRDPPLTPEELRNIMVQNKSIR